MYKYAKFGDINTKYIVYRNLHQCACFAASMISQIPYEQIMNVYKTMYFTKN